MADACTACGCRLVWALTPTGARAPIERDPSPAGNVLILDVSHIGLMAVTLSKEGLQLVRDHGLPLRLNHFASCPEKEQFRRQKAPA
jgi:hypothetical protein